MIVNFDPSITGQQRQWINDTIARSTYPFDNLPDANVTFFAVTEPPCAGHKDLMCTTDEGGGVFHIHIRIGIDSPTGSLAQTFPNPARDIKIFFQECIMHELAHVASYTYINDTTIQTTVAALFTRQELGQGVPTGELADWDTIIDPWEDRIIEAVAEVVKDGALDPAHRIYDNRTNWAISEADYQTLIGIIAPGIPADPGGTVESFVSYAWLGELAGVEKLTSTPIDGTTHTQDFPPFGPTIPVGQGYIGPHDSGSPRAAIDLSSADTITMRLWVYGSASSGPPDFTQEAPFHHLMHLVVGTLLDIDLSGTDLTWEAHGSQPDWQLPTAAFRGYIDIDGRAIQDYCIANGQAPTVQLSRDFGDEGAGWMQWSTWGSPSDASVDQIILEWKTVHTSDPTDGADPGIFSYPYPPPSIHGRTGDGGVMRFTAR